tara:strand:+ start:820 stop:1020 length:201 start_codon:yes stop_codon:yes gene_type:complete
MEEQYWNDEFINIVACNDWSELEEANRPVFMDVTIQPLNDMTIIPIGYIPLLGSIELIIKKDGFDG